MNTFQQRITLRVVGVHAAIIFLLFFIPLVRSCFKPKPKEIVTFIEFGGPAPQVSVQEVASLSDPEPPAPAPEPEPAPIPEPKKIIPKPKVKKPEPKPKEPVKKPAPKPKEPEKPKWKATDPKDINPNKSRKIKATPSKPAISSADINKALSGIASSSSTGNPSQFNDYYAQVMRLFYNNWTPPASATSATGSAVVRITFRKNGQIRTRAKVRGSGDSLYDRTVMDAVNKVSTLPKPPADYPYDYVQITFTLDN